MIDAVEGLRGDEAADHALAVFRLEAVDPHILGRQPVPDRQQQAGDDVKRALGEFRNLRTFGFPHRREFFGGGFAPVRALEMVDVRVSRVMGRIRRVRASTRAVIVHQAGSRDLHRGAMRLLVDQQAGAGVPGQGERLGERQGPVAVLAQHAIAAGFGARRGMGVHRTAFGDAEALGGERLDADVVGAAGNRRFDTRVEQLLEGGEERVLHRDPERQDAVQELRDRRQLFLERTVLVDKIETGRVLKIAERAALDLPGIKQLVELAQCGFGVGAFEIVVGAEQALTAGLALAAGDRAQGVEAARDRRQEALLALDVGRHRAEHRRLLLVGAVRAAQSLDRGIGAPAGLQQVVDAPALVLGIEIGVIAAPGAAGIGEDEDALVVIHKGGGLGEIRRSGTGLDAEAVARALTMRRERPVTSATRSVPKRCKIWSSAPCTGGNDARCSIIRSRRSTASREITGLPSAS